MASTYEPIATSTVSGSTTSSITFSSIPSTYTDLRIVFVGQNNTGNSPVPKITFNSDSATNYSYTVLQGDGSSPGSTQTSNSTSIYIGNSANLSATNSAWALYNVDIFSYAGSTYKTLLSFASADKNGSGNVNNIVGLWRSTSAITSLTIASTVSTWYLSAGTTATLYGILKA